MDGCIGGGGTPLLPTMVLADYTGIWEITNKVFSCNSSKILLLHPLCLACPPPPRIFSRFAHGSLKWWGYGAAAPA